MPCILRWPGKIPAGATNDAMLHVVDFFSTFVSLAGGSLDQELPLDGIDMTQVILHRQPCPREEIIIEVAGSVRLPSIRKGDFKLIGDSLYNLASDPQEKTDVALEHPQIVAELKQRLEQVGKERPPLGERPLLMDPALPSVYGQEENKEAPAWIKQHVEAIRATQRQHWPDGETPWP